MSINRLVGFVLITGLLIGCTQETWQNQHAIPDPQPLSQNSTATFTPQYLPNPQLTPGAIDPAVTQDNIQQTICVSGYSASVRPPSSFTTKLKIQQIQEYGYADTNISDYEEDHFISLEIGGCASCTSNLWPEPYNIPYGARVKDKVENKLHSMICSGEITLADAQQAIATDWYGAYQKYVR